MVEVTIIPPATKCRLVCADRAEATVLAAEIREHGVARYEIVWWQNGDRKTQWVEPHEIEPITRQQATARVIGFGG